MGSSIDDNSKTGVYLGGISSDDFNTFLIQDSELQQFGDYVANTHDNEIQCRHMKTGEFVVTIPTAITLKNGDDLVFAFVFLPCRTVEELKKQYQGFMPEFKPKELALDLIKNAVLNGSLEYKDSEAGRKIFKDDVLETSVYIRDGILDLGRSLDKYLEMTDENSKSIDVIFEEPDDELDKVLEQGQGQGR